MASVKICLMICITLPLLAQSAPSEPQDVGKKDGLKSSELQWFDGLPSPTIYALGCDFPYDDIDRVSVVGELCAQACRDNDKCTHFVHNKAYGVCFLKHRAGINKNDAIGGYDIHNVVCGLDCFTGSCY